MELMELAGAGFSTNKNPPACDTCAPCGPHPPQLNTFCAVTASSFLRRAARTRRPQAACPPLTRALIHAMTAVTMASSSALVMRSRASSTSASSAGSRSRSTARHHQRQLVPKCARANGWANESAASATSAASAASASVALRGRAALLVAHGRKGMLGKTIDGDDGKSKKDKKKKDKAEKGSDSLAGSMEPGFAGKSSGGSGGEGGGGGSAKGNWLTVGNVKEDFTEKPIKALVLANGMERREGHRPSPQTRCMPTSQGSNELNSC